MHFFQDSYKNLEDNALFLQNLAKSYKKVPILEDPGRQGVSCNILTRFFMFFAGFLED